MKKKQLLALALVGAMSATSAASMMPATHAEEQKEMVSDENYALLKERIGELDAAANNPANAGHIIGNERFKKAITEINKMMPATTSQYYYSKLMQFNDLFTTKLGEFYNFTENHNEDIKHESIFTFAKTWNKLLNDVDSETNFTKRYTFDGKEYYDVARYLRAVEASIDSNQKAYVEEVEHELMIAKKQFAAMPAYTEGESLEQAKARKNAEKKVIEKTADLVQAKRALLLKELATVRNVNLTELTHRVQKAITTMAESALAELQRDAAAAEFEKAKFKYRISELRVAIGKKDYANKVNELRTTYSDELAALTARVNDKLQAAQAATITEADVENYIVKRTVAGSNQLISAEKDSLIDSVIKVAKIDINEISDHYSMVKVDVIGAGPINIDYNVTVAERNKAKKASSDAEAALAVATKKAEAYAALAKEDLANMKIAAAAQSSNNEMFYEVANLQAKMKVEDALVKKLEAKEKADKKVSDKKIEIENAKKDTQTSQITLEGLEASLKTLEKEAEEATAAYEENLATANDLGAKYMDFFNKARAKNDEVKAYTNHHDMIDITREAEDFKTAHNDLANKLEMPTFSINQNRATAKEPVNWVKVDGKWYYRSAKGTNKYVSEWALIDNVWYRFDANGAMLSGEWFKDTNNRWYWLTESGKMSSSEWVYVSGEWYYAEGSGAITQSDWVYVDGEWYYAEASGAITQSDWVYVNGSWFYAKSSGAIAQNEWAYVNGAWYYAKDGGYIAINETLKINGTNYSFDASGALK